MLIESFITEKQFIKGYMGADFVNEPALKLARITVSKKRSNVAAFNFHFLVGEKGKIKYFVVKMELAMFDSRRVLKMMRNLGLKTICLKGGLMKFRELYIGVKQ
jgi:hypothetical protein